MKLSVEDLVSRLEEGEELDGILSSLMPPATEETVRRLALVPRFDAAVVELLTAGLEGAPGLEEVAGHPEVEALPNRPGFYRVCPETRRRRWEEWLQTSVVETPAGEGALGPELHALNERLIEHCRREGPEWREPLFYHLVPEHPDEAWKLFDELYREAEERFDLARCHDLVALAEERKAFFDADALERHRARQRALAARQLWSPAYYRTLRFYERESLTARLDALLAENPPGVGLRDAVLQLHATGGMGKTLFLHWAIAHRAVPRRLPCALFDFDDVRTAEEAQPWRILLRLAEQLDRQLPQSPLEYVIREVRDAERTLRRRSAEEEAPASTKPFGDLITAIPQRLGAALGEAELGRPVLFILDTLEEAVLRYDVDLRALLDRFAEIHALCPWTRLILSGRYRLRKRYDDLEPYLDDGNTLEVPPFEAEEARGYLRSRGVEGEERIEAIVEKSGRVPFKLALFADLLRADPAIDAATIRAYPHADLLYLLRRVIRRIDDVAVRWLVRYGVVPRTLTLDFVRRVVREYLESALAGEVAYDDPEIDLEELPEALRETGLYRGGRVDAEIERVWDRLRRYAGASSWVYEVEAERPGAPPGLRFHPNVLGPMRELLERHEVSALLHARAARYFEERAAAEDERRAAHLREAVYHRFASEGPGAEKRWRRWLEEARARGDLETRLELAEEVLGPDYVDETGLPRERRGRGMIEPATLAAAALELASAAIALARRDDEADADGLWKKAEGAYRRLERLGERAGVRPGPEAALCLVEGRLEMRGGDLDRALAAAERGLEVDDGGGAVRRELHELAGDLLRRQRRREYYEHYKLAQGSARRGGPGAGRAVEITERLVAGLLAEGRWGQALEECLETYDAAPDREAWEAAGLLLAGVANGGGRPAVARRVIEELQERGVSPSRVARCRWLLGRSELARGRPLAAREHAASARSALETADEGLVVKVGELRGEAEAALLDEAALKTLSKVRSRYQRLGDVEGAARAAARCAELLLFGFGDLRQARKLIEEGRRFRLAPGSESAVVFEGLRLAVEALRGDRERARALAEELRCGGRDDEPPRTAARRLAALFAWGEPDARDGRALVALLRRIDAPWARAALLRDLDRGQAIAESLRPRLGELLPPADEIEPGRAGEVAPDDRLLYELGTVEIERVLGFPGPAHRRLARVRRTLAEEGAAEPLLERRAWGAAVRLEAAKAKKRSPATAAAPGWLRRLAEEHAEAPLLVGAAAAEVLEAGGGPASGEVFEIAEKALGTVQRMTRWHARLALFAAVRAPESAEEAFEWVANLHAELGWPPPERPPAPAKPPDRVPGERGLGTSRGLDDRRGLALGVGPEKDDRLRRALTVRLERREGSTFRARVRLGDREVWSAEAGIRAGDVPEGPGVSGRFADALGGRWRDLGERLGEVLPIGPALAEIAPPDRPDLRLELDDPSLFAVPWELARRADADGLLTRSDKLGAFYRCADRELTLRHRRERAGGERLDVVLVLCPDREQTRSSQRGFYPEGAGAVRVYKRAGLPVEVLEAPTPSRLAKAVAKLRPAVVHVSCELRESGSFGGVFLDFGVYDEEELGSSNLAWALQDVPEEEQPFVVLDVVRPPGRTETGRQLLLRNVFAGELFQNGSLPAVLAAGLGAPDEQGEMTRALAASLVEGTTVGETADRLRRVDVPDPEAADQPAPDAVALFALDPDFRPLAGRPEAP